LPGERTIASKQAHTNTHTRRSGASVTTSDPLRRPRPIRKLSASEHAAAAAAAGRMGARSTIAGDGRVGAAGGEAVGGGSGVSWNAKGKAGSTDLVHTHAQMHMYTRATARMFRTHVHARVNSHARTRAHKRTG
jgi:hypothetical protein